MTTPEPRVIFADPKAGIELLLLPDRRFCLRETLVDGRKRMTTPTRNYSHAIQKFMRATGLRHAPL